MENSKSEISHLDDIPVIKLSIILTQETVLPILFPLTREEHLASCSVGQLPSARQIIGVDMGLGNFVYLKPLSLGFCQVTLHMSCRVDDDGGPTGTGEKGVDERTENGNGSTKPGKYAGGDTGAGASSTGASSKAGPRTRAEANLWPAAVKQNSRFALPTSKPPNTLRSA